MNKKVAKKDFPDFFIEDYPELKEFEQLFRAIATLKKEKEELRRELKSMGDEVREYFEDKFGDINEFFNVAISLGNAVNLIVSKLLVKKGVKPTEKIKYILSNVNDELRETLEGAKENFMKLKGEVEYKITKLYHKQANILDTIKDVVNSVVEWFKNAISKLRDWAGNLLDVAREIDVDNFEMEDYVGVEELKYAVRKEARVTSAPIDVDIEYDALPVEMQKKVREMLKLIIRMKKITKAIEDLSELFDEKKEELLNNPDLEEAFFISKKSVDGVKRLAKVIKKEPKMVVDNEEYLNYLMENINDSLREGVEKLSEEAGKQERTLQQLPTGFTPDDIEELENLLKEMEKTGSLWDAVKNVGGKVLDFFKNLWNDFVENISDIFGGLVNKLRPSVDAFLDKIEELEENIND